jgi:glycine hydroxymethyltransferase
VASGIRVGSPGVTTQGMREGEMRLIGRLIGAALRSDPDTAAGASRLADVADEVQALVGQFPAYAREEVMA